VKKLLSLFFILTSIIIATFLLLPTMEQRITERLSDTGSLRTYSLWSFIFLTADIILPVPSSMIMILNGKVLGAVAGGTLSLCAGMCCSLIGFAVGRRSKKWADRFFSAAQIKESEVLFERYGKHFIGFSKALPILSETVSVYCGATDTNLKMFLSYSLLGHLSVSVVYGCIGNYFTALDSWAVSFLVIAFTLAVGRLLPVLFRRRSAS
jgi:uncharacterized membrane protein YdjX (TVP38/TMEM64 family)